MTISRNSNFELEEALAILDRTPAVLRALLAGLPEAWVTCNEGPETWSPYDVMGHLISGEASDWIPRARMILEHGERRTFEPFNRTAFVEQSKGKTLTQLLDDFEAARKRSLETLRGLALAPADLSRRGRHPDFGPVTLRQLLATWVAHDFTHLAQVVRVMAKRYDADVGPWKQYLGVLNR
ncbi:MAG TPA: DinB family protein [Gemmatimonadales bacterium]|nr:DinB family protein [Gemmatimonadales bacterium]